MSEGERNPDEKSEEKLQRGKLYPKSKRNMEQQKSKDTKRKGLVLRKENI